MTPGTTQHVSSRNDRAAVPGDHPEAVETAALPRPDDKAWRRPADKMLRRKGDK